MGFRVQGDYTSRVISRITIRIAHMRGLMTLL